MLALGMNAKLKDRLQVRRAELLERTRQVRADLTRRNGPVSADFAEQASETSNDEVLGAIGQAAFAELSQLERTLARIDAGQYGLCAVCRDPIEAPRLQALPYVDRCIRCADRSLG
jgi:RNA polymerase-binding transcription factor DksA